jgi:hypothetical protein
MRTSTRFGTLVAGFAAVSLVGLSGSDADEPGLAPSNRSPVVERITVNTPFEGGVFHYVDVGTPDIGPGDMFTVTGLPLRSEKTGKRIGAIDALETVLSARHDGTVRQELTFRFAGGTVDVAGNLRHTDKPIRLPVVGGTGSYVGVTGQLREIREDPQRKVSVTRLILIHEL